MATQEITKQLENSKTNVAGCLSAFEIYKKNLKKCYESSNEGDSSEELQFQLFSFEVSNCFKAHDEYLLAKEVFHFSLKHPNWTMQPYECNGHYAWLAALEKLEISKETCSKCISKPELMDLLIKFKETQDTHIFRAVRASDFYYYTAMEGCNEPLSNVEKIFKERFVNSKNWKSEPVYWEHSDLLGDNYYYVAFNGFAKNPNEQLILVFYDLSAESADKTQPDLPCYVLTGYRYYENIKEMNKDGYTFEPKKQPN